MPTAIVTGATGILGREIVQALGKAPQIWTQVHALSRSQREEYPSNVRHDRLDLAGSSPEEIAKQLKEGNVQGEYLFFSAYLQQGDEEEMTRVNGGMLRNFLHALQITGADQALKRVILTTGAKQFGVHLGPVKLPMEEGDRWVEGPGRPPNFYYEQQRILHEMSKNKHWDWVVTYPNDVIGVAKGNFMNLVTAIGLYAAITKELGQPFIFPGDPGFYTGLDCFTYSRLHAEFVLWAANEPKAGNEAFNVVNGDVESWQNLWPRLARHFGLHIPADQFSSSHTGVGEDHELGSVTQLIERPPLADWAREMGIVGRVHRGEIRAYIDLTKWSKKPEVKEAWERLAKREGLQHDAFDKATWSFLNFILGRSYDLVISMNKARKMGFQGFADTWDSLNECLCELEDEKILPKREKK